MGGALSLTAIYKEKIRGENAMIIELYMRVSKGWACHYIFVFVKSYNFSEMQHVITQHGIPEGWIEKAVYRFICIILSKALI